jgi:uncharacterized tellurite resistance protein B-like protein
MLARLRTLLFSDPATLAPRPHGKDELQLAAAALLVEAALMDGPMSEEEREKVTLIARRRFGLDPAEAADLVLEAERAAEDSADWHGFTRAIKAGFDQEERVGLIEMLWEVVYADGRLHDHEASLLRRIAGLLYVDDRSRAEARRRALTRLGLDPEAQA